MLWIVVDHCRECGGEPIAVFDNEKDARSLCHAYPWLTWFEIDTEELIGQEHQYEGYEEWFNKRADRALRERDCD